MVAPLEENELVGQSSLGAGLLFMAGGLNAELTHPGLLWLLLQPGLWPMDFGLCLLPSCQLSCSQGDHCRREDGTGSYRQVCATSPRAPKEAQACRRASCLGQRQP